MSDTPASITFEKHGRLQSNIELYRLADGTILCCDFMLDRLYADMQGKEVSRDLPEESESHGIVIENALYFITSSGKSDSESSDTEASDRHIYKAVITRSKKPRLKIEYVRDIAEDESNNDDGVFWRVDNGKMYIYRICDDPYGKDVLVMAEAEGKWATKPHALLHHGRLITLQCRSNVKRPRLINKTGNGLIIEIPFLRHPKCFVDYTSPYIYFIINGAIHTLHSVNAEFLPSLQIREYDTITGYAIAGVYNGEMTIGGSFDDNFEDTYKMSARLPEGYFTPHVLAAQLDNPCWQNVESLGSTSSSMAIGAQSDFTYPQMSAVAPRSTAVGQFISTDASRTAAPNFRADDEPERAGHSQSLNASNQSKQPTVRKYVRKRQLEEIDDDKYLNGRKKNKLACRKARQQKAEYDYFLQLAYDRSDPKPTPAALGLPNGFACGSDGNLKPFEVTKRQKEEWKRNYGSFDAFE